MFYQYFLTTLTFPSHIPPNTQRTPKFCTTQHLEIILKNTLISLLKVTHGLLKFPHLHSSSPQPTVNLGAAFSGKPSASIIVW